MKNGFWLFVGLLAALLVSWSAIVLGANHELGSLAPYYDDTESLAYPQGAAGTANQGALVYRDLNCAACHTQQVRRAGFGSDIERGWGARQSVARDYIYQPVVMLGNLRLGPDLANLAGRKPSAPDAQDLYQLLYLGHGAMPSYSFLFDDRKVIGQPSDEALQLVGRHRPAEGHEVVPTPRARRLVAYLLSLNSSYDYPEAQPAAVPKGEGK